MYGLYNKIDNITSATPQVVNVQQVANFIGSSLMLFNFGSNSNTDIIFVQSPGSPGDPIAVFPGSGIRLNGSFTQIEVTGMNPAGTTYQLTVSEIEASLPNYIISSSGGGGGGGGGAPTGAPYLLSGNTVDPALTAGVAIGALPSDKLRFSVPLPLSSDLTNVIFPLESAVDVGNGYNVGTGGGVGHIFQLTDAAHPGGIDIGSIRFMKVAGLAHYDLEITGIGGEVLMTINSINGPYSSGITFTGKALLQTTGSDDLVLQTVNGNTLVRAQTHDVVKFGVGTVTLQESGKFQGVNNVTVQAATGKSLTLTTDGGQSGIGIDDSAGDTVQIVAGGNAWLFNDVHGDLSGPGTQGAEIKNIHAATADSSAPTWGQVKGYASPYQTINFGASSTGATSDSRAMLYGPPYAAAVNNTYSNTWFWTGRAGKISGGQLLAESGPTGVSDQVFTIYKNGVPTTWTATLTATFISGSAAFVNSGADVTFTPSDIINIGCVVGNDPTDVGALNVQAFVHLTYS